MLLPPPDVPVVDATPKPWPRSPRRCEENATAQRSREHTGPGNGQNHHREGIHGDAVTQRKDEDNTWILLKNPGGIEFVAGRRHRESCVMYE